MTDVTQILSEIESGDPSAASHLLPLIYEELRRLATARLANEKPGQTLQAAALVHEACIRLVDAENAQKWDSRGHSFAAAAEVMRRILADRARRKSRLKHGKEGYARGRKVDEIKIRIGIAATLLQCIVCSSRRHRAVYDHLRSSDVSQGRLGGN